MKANIVLVAVVAAVLLPVMMSSCRVRSTLIFDDFDIKSWTMIVEEIDAAGTLYRIDISFPEEPEQWPDIDYNLKVKFQTVVLTELEKCEIIDMIREECPENVTGITVRF